MYVSSLDRSMGYYHIELSSGAKQLCTSILPWDNYEYKKLTPGGLMAPISSREIYPNYLKCLTLYVRTYTTN